MRGDITETGAIGAYVTCDDAECADCHDPDAWAGFEDWVEPIHIFAGTEADAPTHCTVCEALIPHALTEEGLAYVAEMLADDGGRPEIEAQWVEEYGNQLEELAH